MHQQVNAGGIHRAIPLGTKPQDRGPAAGTDRDRPGAAILQAPGTAYHCQPRDLRFQHTGTPGRTGHGFLAGDGLAAGLRGQHRNSRHTDTLSGYTGQGQAGLFACRARQCQLDTGRTDGRWKRQPDSPSVLRTSAQAGPL